MTERDALLAPMEGAQSQEIGGVKVDMVRTGTARVRRLVYPPGYRWSTHIKPLVGTDVCMHGHVGFLARGRFHIQFVDGCVREFEAPEVLMIEPGHDAWVVGDESAVLIEFDFEKNTLAQLGIATNHEH